MKKLLTAFVLVLLVTGRPEAADLSSGTPFSPPGEKFSVLFPGVPFTQTRSETTPVGKIHTRVYMSQAGPLTYGLAVVDLPQTAQELLAQDPEAALENFAGPFLSAFRGQPLSQKKTTVAGHPAREIEASLYSGQGIGRFQVIFAGDRYYVLMLAAPREQDIATEAREFFDSFKVKRKNLLTDEDPAN